MENALRLSEMMGGSYRFDLIKGYPAMVNYQEVNDWMRQVTHDLAGTAVIKNEPFGMGAEDRLHRPDKLRRDVLSGGTNPR